MKDRDDCEAKETTRLRLGCGRGQREGRWALDSASSKKVQAARNLGIASMVAVVRVKSEAMLRWRIDCDEH